MSRHAHLVLLVLVVVAASWLAGPGRLDAAGIKQATDRPQPNPPEKSIKLFKVLGVDFNYNYLGENEGTNGEVFASKIRASAIIYPIPTRVLSWYLLGGLGASNIGDMFSNEMTNKSFHAGTGLEIYAGRHFTVTAEFLMLIPDVSRIAVSKQPIQIGTDGKLPASGITQIDIKDYISPDSFQINIGVKYFF